MVSVIHGKGTGNRGTVKRGIQPGNEKDGLKKLVFRADCVRLSPFFALATSALFKRGFADPAVN